MADDNLLLYFDYNATTPLTESVIKKINDCLYLNWGNPSSTYPEGVTSKECIDVARSNLAKLLDCNSEDIIFTSGGTEVLYLHILDFQALCIALLLFINQSFRI